MIEFKRAGDAMVFECPCFKIEVAPGTERIELNRETINSNSDFIEHVTDAFKILDMMIEHKARHTHVMKADFDIDDARNKDPLKNFRAFMKKEGL